jgi:hypothetical protein
VQKYDGDGNFLWTRQFGTDSADYPRAASGDGDGNVLVAGFTDGTLPVSPRPTAS